MSTECPQGHLLAMVSSRIRKQTRLGKLTRPALSLYRSVMRLSSSLVTKIPERNSGMGRQVGELSGHWRWDGPQ